MCLTNSCSRHSQPANARMAYLSSMQDKDYVDIQSSQHNLRTPANKFFSFLLVGAFASAGVLLFPSLAQQEWYFPYIELEWLRPAAGILATVAVASIILDGPLQQALTRQQPKPQMRPDFADTDRYDHSTSTSESAFGFVEKQLKAGDYVIMGTGFLAAMCACLAIFEVVEEGGLASGPNYSLLPRVIFTILAHAVIVGVCSIGLGYDNERFLQQRLTWRNREYRSQWSELWQLTEAAKHDGRSTSRRPTVSIALVYGLMTFAFMLIPFGISVEYASDDQTFQWFSKHGDIPTPIIIPVASIFSLLLVLISWIKTYQVMEHQVSIRKFKATGSSSFADLLENKYTSIVINVMSTMLYIIIIGILFTLFGLISSLAAGTLMIIQFVWLRGIRHKITELDLSDEAIWHENVVSSTFNIGQRLRQEAVTSFHRADNYLQKHACSHTTGICVTEFGHR